MAQARTYVFKDARLLTGWLTALLVASLAADLLSAVLIVALGEAGAYTGAEEAFSPQQLLRWASDILILVTRLPSFVLGAFWILQASRNAHSFKPTMTHSVGGSIGWYFVPIANLAVPYQAMDEIWGSSVPKEARKTGLLHAWWALWLISNIFSWIVVFGGRNGLASPALEAASMVLDAVSVAAFLVLVRRLARHQRETYAAGVFSDPAPEMIAMGDEPAARPAE